MKDRIIEFFTKRNQIAKLNKSIIDLESVIKNKDEVILKANAVIGIYEKQVNDLRKELELKAVAIELQNLKL